MNYFDIYRTKMIKNGMTPYESNMKVKQREFDSYFKDTLNRSEACVYDKELQKHNYVLAFQDHSQSNNKDLSDDKYVIAPNESPISVGDYVEWRGTTWLIFTEEFKTIPTHQQAKMKNANQSIRWIRNGEIVNDGMGYHAYVQSQTLYTMGIATTTYIDNVDSKMLMYMQNNKYTRDIQQDERVFIGAKVYKVKFIDAMSRRGLISFLLDEDTVHDEFDNIELGVADYYKYYGTDLDFTQDKHVKIPELTDDKEYPQITGATNAKIGSINNYQANFDVVEWVVDCMEAEQPYYINSREGNELQLRIKDDYRFIGSQINIMAKDDKGQYYTLSVVVAKKY